MLQDIEVNPEGNIKRVSGEDGISLSSVVDNFHDLICQIARHVTKILQNF